MMWSFPWYGRVGPGQESLPPDVEQPTSARARPRVRSTKSRMFILLHRPSGHILEPGEVLEQREIDLVGGPALNWNTVPKDCGDGYGCFMSLNYTYTLFFFSR